MNYENFSANVRRERIMCADGFTMSVQAGPGLYSCPRAVADSYTEVEVGFPSGEEPLLLRFMEGTNPTETVYPYVPAEIILAVINKHGGMIRGELPPLKATK